MSVLVEQQGPRVDVILDRPEVLNAMDWGVFDALAAAADDVASRKNVRVVVVSGKGRSFCSGIDTRSFGEINDDAAGRIARAQAGFRKIAALPMPTVAKVHGHALGAGLQLALACDIRVVAADASLGLLEAKYGIVPDLGGTQRLPRLVGAGRAKKMIWLAERVDGRMASEIGLAEVVVDADRLDTQVDELAQRIAEAPPLVVHQVKRLVDLAGSVPHESGMDEEASSQVPLLGSEDFIEAISAFIEKRAPRYQGR